MRKIRSGDMKPWFTQIQRQIRITRDNIKSSDLTEQEQRDLSTQSMNRECNKCQCEPNLTKNINLPMTYTECLGSIWSDHQEKILTDIINELTKLNTDKLYQ